MCTQVTMRVNGQVFGESCTNEMIDGMLVDVMQDTPPPNDLHQLQPPCH
jgi:hypothetical protein